MSKTENKTPLVHARVIAKDFLQSNLLNNPVIVGSIGRGELMVGDIDILAENPNRLGQLDNITFNGMQVNIWFTNAVNRESMQLFLMGPKSDNIARAAAAKAAGYKYNMYGLWKDEVRVANDKISIEKMIHETDGVGEETLTNEYVKFAKLTHPSGDYLQIGSIRIEELKNVQADVKAYKVISVFELWSDNNLIRRYEKIKCEQADIITAENVFNKWIEQKTAKGYKLVK